MIFSPEQIDRAAQAYVGKMYEQNWAHDKDRVAKFAKSFWSKLKPAARDRCRVAMEAALQAAGQRPEAAATQPDEEPHL